MEVTNFEIIERGCCCFLEIKLISTWNVNKQHMSENTWIVYTLYFIPRFFSGLGSHGIHHHSTHHHSLEPSLEPSFFHPSIVDKARFPCGFGVEIHPRRCRVFGPFVFQPAPSFQNLDDRRPLFRSMKWRFQMVLLLQRPFFFFPFFRSLLKQGSLYKVYPFLVGGESNNYNANLW